LIGGRLGEPVAGASTSAPPVAGVRDRLCAGAAAAYNPAATGDAKLIRL
jgi:hypothetical protein